MSTAADRRPRVPTRAPRAATSTEEPPDTAREVAAFLRHGLRASRRRRRGDLLYVAYVVALFAVVYVLPLGGAALQLSPGPLTPWDARVAAALPAVAAAVAVWVLSAAAADALWRGPVLVDAPSAAWLLSTPMRPEQFLQARFRRAVPIYGVTAAVLWGALGFVAQVVTVGTATRALLLVVLAGLGLGALAAGVAAHVEQLALRPSAVQRVIASGRVAALALGGLAATAASGAPLPPVVGDLLLWSGPWGWAAQPLAAATGSGEPPVAAVLLLAAVGVVALLTGHHAAARVPRSVLRARVVAVGVVSGSLLVLDLRQARLAARRAAGTAQRRPRLMLPAPRSRLAVLEWRIVTGWLREPVRLGRAALLSALALAVLVLSTGAAGGGRLVLVGGAVLVLYAAAGELVEAARLEDDDHARSRGLPWRYSTLLVRHAVAPAVVLLVAAALLAVAAAVSGAPWLPLVALVALVPAVVVAAIVSGCRGPLPHELLVGRETPVGNTTGVQVLAWMLRVPLVVVVGATPLLLAAVHRPVVAHDLAYVGGAVACGAALLAACVVWLSYEADMRYRH